MRLWVLTIATMLAAAPAVAREQGAPAEDMAAMQAAWEAAMTPGPEHALLAERAGTWSMTMTIFGPPGAPPEVNTGVMERRMEMGGRVLVDRLESEMMGMPLTGMATTGYDNVTGRYWSTWTDSMTTALSILHGEMGPEGGVLEGTFSEPLTGTRQPMRIETEMEGPDRQVDRFYMPGPDGGMIQTMEVVYERQ